MDRAVTPALESIQRYMIVGAIMFGCVTLGIGGWAATTQLSGAVIAQGVVVVDSSVKKVQHATGGIVGELRVREGDKVNHKVNHNYSFRSGNWLARSANAG